jgi:hypothetical protein
VVGAVDKPDHQRCRGAFKTSLRSTVASLLAGGLLFGGVGAAAVFSRSDVTCAFAWRAVPMPNVKSGYLKDIAAISANDVWAVGLRGPFKNNRTLTEHWDGNSWGIVRSPSAGRGNELDGVAGTSSSDVWAVGYRDNYGLPNRPKTLIEHWDGTSWKIVPYSRPGSLYAVAAVSSSDVWIVGEHSGNSRRALIQHWDGRSWSAVNSPPRDPTPTYMGYGQRHVSLFAVSGLSADDVWAVGADGGDQPLAEHWDGSQWSVLLAPRLSTDPNAVCSNDLLGVAAVSATDVWAVGSCASGPISEHWDGTSWTYVGIPYAHFARNYRNQEDSQLSDVAATPAGDVWAVGNFGFEHWDGEQWQLAGPRRVGPYAISIFSSEDIWVLPSRHYVCA